MLNTTSLKSSGKFFRCIDGNRTYEHGLAFLMTFFNFMTDGIEFSVLGFVNRIVLIDSDNGNVRRNFDNVHSVDLTEFLLFCKSCTGHAGFLFKFIKEVLECNGSQSL